MIFFNDVVQNFDFLMKGLSITLQLAVVSVVCSLILGLFLGIVRYSKLVFFSWLAAAYIELVRSIPLILFIIFIHFGFLPYIMRVETTVFQSSAIALSVFTSAYIAEIIRSGLKSIEMGHIDAARSLGLNYFQRLGYIIIPLSVKRMTPALVSQFITLIKDTSLASTIGLIELTRSGELIYERTYKEFEILIFIAFIYFIICFGLSLISKKLESRQT